MALEWSDLNPLTWPGQIKQRLSDDYNTITGDPGLKPEEERRRKLLEQQAAAAGDLANYGTGQYMQLGRDADSARSLLEQHANGQQSYSREALRQGLQQQLAQQRSMAAGAGPNAAMAARTAANNMARASYGMSGQAAMSDIAERQAFAKALADATLQQRQQDLQAALQSRQNAMTGYGAGQPYQYDKSWLEKYGPAVVGAASLGLGRKGKGA